MSVIVLGTISLIAFYVIVFVVALWAKRLVKDSSEVEMILAGRRLGFITGTITLTASYVGAGVWNGAVEVIFSRGLIWTQTPVFFGICIVLGSFLIMKPLREANVFSVIDLFQKKYGVICGAAFGATFVLTDIVILSAILNSLDVALVPLMGISPMASSIFSSIFVGVYTSIGSMFAVVYTDIVQLLLMIFGIMIAVPFVATHNAVDTSKVTTEIFGHIEEVEIAHWLDMAISITLGALTLQTYAQRILSMKTTKIARSVSLVSAACIFLLSLPAVFLGILARVTDWEAVPTFNRTIIPEDMAGILPLTLYHLTPQWVSVFSLSAVAAAAMSSADSSLMSSTTCFSINIYKNIFRPKAGETEMAWVIRITNLITPLISVLIAMTTTAVYDLLVLGQDLKMTVMFPHIMILFYWTGEKNAYGALSSLTIGILLRILGGLHVLGIPSIIQYPGFNPVTKQQLFPHRSLTMVLVAVFHLSISWAAKFLFDKKIIGRKFDILKVFTKNPEMLGSSMRENQTDQPLLDLKTKEVETTGKK